MNPLNPPQNTSKWPRNFATNRIAPIQMVHRSAVTTATSTHSSAAAVIWTCTITDSCRVRTEYSQTIYIEIMADDDDKTNQKNNQQANKSTILIFIYFMLSIFSQNIMRWPTYGCVTFCQIHGSHHATRIVRTFTNRCAADKATSLIYSPTNVNCDCTIANTMTVCWFSVVMPRHVQLLCNMELCVVGNIFRPTQNLLPRFCHALNLFLSSLDFQPQTDMRKCHCPGNVCTREYAPICATNGHSARVYNNMCLLQTANCQSKNGIYYGSQWFDFDCLLYLVHDEY